MESKTTLEFLMSLIIWMLLKTSAVDAWLVAQPQENVWITLAKTLQQDHMCLSMGSATNPLSSCLVGIPLKPHEYPFTGKEPNPVDTWDEWTKILPHAPEEPQELELLGSSKAAYCINFNYHPVANAWPASKYQKAIKSRKNVTPNSKIYSQSKWCNYTGSTRSTSSHYPRVLPRGVFLICGDRVWAGIPSRLRGGPCTLGQLTILTPNSTLINDWLKKNELAHQKKDLTQLDEKCDNQIKDRSYTKKIVMSAFLPWAAAAKALGEPSHLECWLGKQANRTSSVLSDLLTDEETVRHATLQNRAAIDFLLLAHGHGCEESDGLCCFNLSSPSEGIHARIQRLQHAVQKLQAEKEPQWLEDLFVSWGLERRVASVLKNICWVFLIVIIFLSMFACFKKLSANSLGDAFLINKEVGVVGAEEPAGPEILALPWRGDTSL
ncbi:uncharacterized protein LOC131590192 [Poecile atricapillus]|uniref:uncharacterized protein LOC131590192 n=1 Tax=Poecile atricapillus TaxID=48891 RepID=UPI0027394631|nr:uncharacterized protein LOC131590192 [Poecile atricapillus]